MKRLLDIELHKFKYSRSSKILTIIYLTIVVAMMFLGLVRIEINGFSGALSDLGIFDFPLLWHMSTYFTSFLKIGAGVFKPSKDPFGTLFWIFWTQEVIWSEEMFLL